MQGFGAPGLGCGCRVSPDHELRALMGAEVAAALLSSGLARWARWARYVIDS